MLKKIFLASLLTLLSISSSAQAAIVNGAPLSDIDNNFTVGSVVAVGNLGTITDLNVSYYYNNISAGAGLAFWTDTQIQLTSPLGTTVTLFPGGGAFGATAGVLDVTLDDSAAVQLPIAGGSFTGTFLPFSPLSAFNGENTAGNWTISFIDPVLPFEGDDLIRWSLDFTTTAAVPEPASMAIWGGLALAGAVAGYRRRKTA